MRIPPNVAPSHPRRHIKAVLAALILVNLCIGHGAAVAQQVVLYEEDAADQSGKRFAGSTIWRTDMVKPDPKQPPELVVRADVEVPERKLIMTWTLRRNSDKDLPASHAVGFMFKLPRDFAGGGVSNVVGMLMKQGALTRGEPLAGIVVKVAPGFYLMGLSNRYVEKESESAFVKGPGLARRCDRVQHQPPSRSLPRKRRAASTSLQRHSRRGSNKGACLPGGPIRSQRIVSERRNHYLRKPSTDFCNKICHKRL